MNKYIMARLILICLTVIALGGCTDVLLKININQDLSADFTESVVLDAAITNQLVLKGKLEEGEDFWSRFKQLAESRDWNLQEKASNYFQINGYYKPGTLTELGGLLGDQFASAALDLGAKPLARQKTPKLLSSSYTLKKTDSSFAHQYQVEYDLDLSYNNLKKRIEVPKEWESVLTRQYTNSPSIVVSVKTPFKVTKTNGTYDPFINSVSWKLKVGENNKLQATFEIVDWNKVSLAGGALLVVLIIILLLVVQNIRHHKKENNEPTTPAEKPSNNNE